MTDTKKWYRSKGVWIGIVTSAIGSLEIVAKLLSESSVSLEGIVMAALGIFKIWERLARSSTQVTF